MIHLHCELMKYYSEKEITNTYSFQAIVFLKIVHQDDSRKLFLVYHQNTCFILDILSWHRLNKITLSLSCYGKVAVVISVFLDDYSSILILTYSVIYKEVFIKLFAPLLCYNGPPELVMNLTLTFDFFYFISNFVMRFLAIFHLFYCTFFSYEFLSK